jgi:hypothetical protein
MPRISAGLKWMIGLVSVVAALLAIAGVFQPHLRHWLLSHAALGWAVALGAAALLCFAVGVATSTVGEASSSRFETPSFDAALLNERLMGWRQSDSFMEWLTYHFHANMVPTDRSKEVEVRARAWDNDTRSFASPRIESAFNELRRAVEEFYDVSVTLLWFGNETHYEWLELRSRHGDKDHDEDVDTVLNAREILLGALQDMFKVAQAERVILEEVS